jgi:hypothetical protein
VKLARVYLTPIDAITRKAFQSGRFDLHQNIDFGTAVGYCRAGIPTRAMQVIIQCANALHRAFLAVQLLF